MKKVLFLSSVLMVCFLFKAYAADPVVSDKTTAVAGGSAQLVEVPNKFCPVSHEEVGKNGMAPNKITYNGKVYNLCCKMCEKDFNKDPQKYVKAIEDQMAETKKI